jgi:Glycosyltransferase family 87
MGHGFLGIRRTLREPIACVTPGEPLPLREVSAQTAREKLRIWTLRAVAVHAGIIFIPLIYHPLYVYQFDFALGDVSEYFRYASLILSGAVPYRDFSIEYPPLALLLFLVPRVLTPRFGLYVALFAVEMLICDAVAVYLVAQWVAKRGAPSGVPRALVWYTAFLAALYPLLAVRYDLAPMAAAFAAAVWWFSGRPALGGAMAAVGTFLKVFPGCIAGPALVWEARRCSTTRLRGVLTFGALVFIGGIAWWGIGGQSTIHYHLERRLQIETLWAGLAAAVGSATHAKLSVVDSGRAWELQGTNLRYLTNTVLPIQGMALLLVLWHMWRSKAPDPFRYAGAAVLVVVVTGKVLSPQYLIWLVPFVAVWEGPSGRWARLGFLVACLLTMYICLCGYGGLLRLEPFAIVLLNCRNAALVALLGIWLFGVPQRASMPAWWLRLRRPCLHAYTGDG